MLNEPAHRATFKLWRDVGAPEFVALAAWLEVAASERAAMQPPLAASED